MYVAQSGLQKLWMPKKKDRHPWRCGTQGPVPPGHTLATPLEQVLQHLTPAEDYLAFHRKHDKHSNGLSIAGSSCNGAGGAGTRDRGDSLYFTIKDLVTYPPMWERSPIFYFHLYVHLFHRWGREAHLTKSSTDGWQIPLNSHPCVNDSLSSTYPCCSLFCSSESLCPFHGSSSPLS